jgi:DNA-binding beta-propeller fold protein YncE
MPTDAYVSVDIAAGDVPSIAVVINDVMTIMKFSKNAEFIVPQPRRKAIWPTGEADAADSGIDLTVHPYTWWIVLDGYAQIGVTFKPAHGNSYVLEVCDGRQDTLVKIYPAVAKALFNTFKSGIRVIKEHLRTGAKSIFKPAETVLEYHVRSWVYREYRGIADLPAHGPFPPRFR